MVGRQLTAAINWEMGSGGGGKVGLLLRLKTDVVAQLGSSTGRSKSEESVLCSWVAAQKFHLSDPPRGMLAHLPSKKDNCSLADNDTKNSIPEASFHQPLLFMLI